VAVAPVAQAVVAVPPVPVVDAERRPVPIWYWILFGASIASAIGFYTIFTFVRLEVFKMLLGSFFPLALMILAVLGSIVFGFATPTEAAAIGSAGGFILAAAYKQLNFRRGQGVGLPYSKDLGHGLLAVRRLLDLFSGLRPVGRAGPGREMGALAQHDALAVHAPEPVHHFHLGLAAEWTEIIVIFMPIFIRSCRTSVSIAVLRPAGGAQSADGLP
jgi:hypothetical protein